MAPESRQLTDLHALLGLAAQIPGSSVGLCVPSSYVLLTGPLAYLASPLRFDFIIAEVGKTRHQTGHQTLDRCQGQLGQWDRQQEVRIGQRPSPMP